ARQVVISVPTDVKRTPYFCAGCPHNTSTRVPEGSKALAGIGCHFMATYMERDTGTHTHMGGEGANWIGQAPFTKTTHVFQNLGDGTYFHSGLLAIRACVAANVNITYKILFNDAVAMTGGQPVDGVITVPAIANQVRSEGVQRIAVMSDEPEKYTDKALFPAATSFHHRDELDAVQRELRDTAGVTVLIYDQTCAAEKRRLRKKGAYPDPDRRMFINQAVCEGCGDCSVQSNCLSIYPVDTELGRKRKIDQSSCNKDYSCVKGFCPSFVSVLGGRLRRSTADPVGDELESRVAGLPLPAEAALSDNFNLLVAGIGGTGVVTVGALITMAAHLEGKGASVLDFTGFAQKGGAVISHIRIGSSPAALNQVRIADGCADAVVACDIVVGTDPRTVRVLARERTRVLVNHSEVPSGQFVRNRNADIRMREREAAITAAVGEERLHTVPANELMERILGNTVYANVFLLGHAWQQGLVPVSLAALEQALALNGVNVAENLQAFAWGRVAAVDADYVARVAGLVQVPSLPPSLEEIVEHRAGLLVQYQNESLAREYRDFVAAVKAREQAIKPGSTALAEAVARNLYKLMAYKDEYEVARLYTDGEFRKQLEATFEGDYTLQFHLAPPVFSRGLDEQGRPRKRSFGPWMLRAFALLARFRGLRGTRLDPFGYHPDRRQERALIVDYRALVSELLAELAPGNFELALQAARLPEDVRGYGPVKAESVARYQQQRAELLQRFHDPLAAVQLYAAAGAGVGA
ncbi:MAG: indolepyruvate ferredoxin oxidoreductase family protein, partial [Haliea sp.]|uniref:indolepyruvate ferredoxin oxidoreductase family protein n=1 Tax=Haliea sp. TaxID=1932666 RepID=UPI0032F0429D